MSRPSIHTSIAVLTILTALVLTVPLSAGPIPSIGAFLSSTDHVSADALTAIGYSGPVDVDSYIVRFDPDLGPRFARQTGSRNAKRGIDIEAAAIYRGMLVLAGRFEPVDGTRSANIVGWNGHQWVSLGRFGTNGTVFGLTVYDDRLIVAGDFTAAGNDRIDHIAAWDGRYFSSLSDGLEMPVFALTVYNSRLIAAGLNGLGSLYGFGCSGVIAWDGDRWSCDGYKIQGIVREIENTGDRLAATGQFFGYPIGRPDTTLYFDGNSWSESAGTRGGVAATRTGR